MLDYIALYFSFKNDELMVPYLPKMTKENGLAFVFQVS